MAKPKPDTKPEAYGLSVVKAPGGGLVVIGGPIDLSRCESLSPAWTRELRESRPRPVTTDPDEQGRTVTHIRPMDTVVGSERVHGESPRLAAGRLSRQAGLLLNRALLGVDVAPLELLEAIQRVAKPVRKTRGETAKDKRIRTERAMDLLGKPDSEVRRALLKAGRSEAQVAKYLAERAA